MACMLSMPIDHGTAGTAIAAMQTPCFMHRPPPELPPPPLRRLQLLDRRIDVELAVPQEPLLRLGVWCVDVRSRHALFQLSQRLC